MRRNRKTRTAELVRLLNSGPPNIGNPRYQKLHRIWIRAHVFPLLAVLVPEALEMIEEWSAPEYDLLRTFADLFDEVDVEEIDAVLQELGYDPDKIGKKMKAVAEQMLAEVRP